MKLSKIIFLIILSCILFNAMTSCKTTKTVTKERTDSTSYFKEDRKEDRKLDSVNVKTWDRETVIEYALEDKSLSWIADLRDSVRADEYLPYHPVSNRITKITIREKGKDSTAKKLTENLKTFTVYKTTVGTFSKDKVKKSTFQWFGFSIILVLVVGICYRIVLIYRKLKEEKEKFKL